jgi:hypothetical protein
MFYALVKQWEDSTKPETFVFFSDRLLGRILRKGWGTNVRDAIVKSLRKLRTIPLEWINSYHQKTGSCPNSVMAVEALWMLEVAH